MTQLPRSRANWPPQRRYWALVGNGKNRVAAAEVRIKLSELCYKSIACDATEDKKHIDLSSEPMILVCAAGLTGSTADDVAKEVAIYKAHKACPIVVATAGKRASRRPRRRSTCQRCTRPSPTSYRRWLDTCLAIARPWPSMSSPCHCVACAVRSSPSSPPERRARTRCRCCVPSCSHTGLSSAKSCCLAVTMARSKRARRRA
jgi:hypothetical protein